jgi:hypothetical protein
VAGVELLGDVGRGELDDGFFLFVPWGRGGFAVGGIALVDEGEDQAGEECRGVEELEIAVERNGWVDQRERWKLRKD